MINLLGFSSVVLMKQLDEFRCLRYLHYAWSSPRGTRGYT